MTDSGLRKNERFRSLTVQEDISSRSISFRNRAGALYDIFINDDSTQLLLGNQQGGTVVLADLNDIPVDLDDDEVWTTVSFDNSNRSFNPDHQITPLNINNLSLEKEINILPNGNIDGRSLGDLWVGITVDSVNIYLALHNLQDASGNVVYPGGMLMAVNRNNGTINWVRNMENYSGVTNDLSRSAPAVKSINGKRCVVFASNRLFPQTWRTTVGGTDNTVFGLFDGASSMGSNRRVHVYCVNANDGSLIWSTPIGAVAQKVDDIDNHLTITTSPIFFTKNGTDYIAVGTSSGQSFIGAINSRSPTTIFGGAKPIQDNRYRMTDMGRLVVMEASTGTIIQKDPNFESALVSAGPPIYNPGTVLDNSLPVENGGGYLRPGETQHKLRRYVESSDISEDGQLGINGVLANSTSGSNGEDQWIGSQRLTYFLEEDSIVVPGPLNDLNVKDRTNTPIKLVGHSNYTSKTIANPTVLNVASGSFPFTSADIGIFVNILEDDDIPSGSYEILAVGGNTLTINYNNLTGSTNGGIIVSLGVNISNITTTGSPETVTTSTPHGLATGDVIVIANRVSGDVPIDRYIATVIDPTNFTINYDNSSGSGGSGGYIALIDRGGDGRDCIVHPLINGGVFSVNTTFVSGSISFTVSETGNTFDLSAKSSNLDGSIAGVPARIWKYIQDGDVLDDQDAYEASYHGPSLWGSSMAVITDNNGDALEMILAFGQTHHIPLDEMEAISTSSASPGYIPQENIIKAAEDTFSSTPTSANLNILRNETNNRAVNVASDKAVPLSPRGDRSFHNSIVSVNLREGAFGDILWSFKTQGYDTWSLPLNLFSLRSLASPANPTTPIDFPSYNVFPVFQWFDVQNYYDIIKGPDGDFGEGPYLVDRGNSVYVAGTTKGALYCTLQLSNPRIGPSSITPLPGFSGTNLVVGGAASILGGSNLGSGADDNRVYSVQLQAPAYNGFNLSFQTNDIGDYSGSGMPQPYPPQTRWYPSNTTQVNPSLFYEQQQSYISAYNIRNQTIDWEAPVIPNDTAPFAATLGCPSISGNYVYVGDGLGNLQIKNKNNGASVKTIKLQNGGVTKPILVGSEIIMCTGRQGYSGNFNTGVSSQSGANYLGTNKIYKFSI